MMEFLIDVLRWAVFLSGVLDSIKYKFLSNKISRLKSSREVSRKFINVSILNRILLLTYAGLVLHDWVIWWSCVIALYTLAEAFWVTYLHYPYKTRGLKNFKRPSIWKYTWNSLLPNNIRERL